MDYAAPKQRINALIRTYKYPILVALLGLLLMLLPTGGDHPDPQQAEAAAPEQTLEQRLELILSQIAGAGEVRVLLTEEAGPQTLYQTDSASETDGSGSRRSDDTVLVENDTRQEQGLIRQILEPRYRGAVVLCQGADQPSVRLAVVEAVKCVTGLGADQISVLKMQ